MSIGAVAPEDVIRNEGAYANAREWRAQDDSRPYFYYRSGSGGDYRGIMTTLGFGTPIQEDEEWISHWAKTRQDPFVPSEQQIMPLVHEADLWQQRHGRGIVLPEHHARYFGEASYTRLTEPLLQNIDKSWKTCSPVWLSEGAGYRDDLYSLAYSRVLRSWRTYGINGYLVHVSFKASEIYSGDKLNPFGETLQKVNMPFLFYIGGPKDDFVSKDHNYFAGESIVKSLIAVNDTFHDVTGTLTWETVADSGQKQAGGTAEVTIKQGQVFFHPITFAAPDVRSAAGSLGRSAMTLKASFTSRDGRENGADSFRIGVFQKPDPIQASETIGLIDESGETEAAFKKMGVNTRRLDSTFSGDAAPILKNCGVLIVGRRSYPLAARIMGSTPSFHDLIKGGLNVLVLEQMNRSVAGLALENSNTRRAFIADKASPLLAGLGDEDFFDWRGESRLLPAYLSWNTNSNWRAGKNSKMGQGNSFGQGRFWHWSNKGMVATFCYQKPQLGNFRVLLSSGFDMLYTPLVEFRSGKGCVLFSQLDLVDHVGVEPVATLLMRRMIEAYGSRGRVAPASMGCVGEKARILLDELGVEYLPGLVGPVSVLDLGDVSATTVKASDIAGYVGDGATLVISMPVITNAVNKSIPLPSLPSSVHTKDDTDPSVLLDGPQEQKAERADSDATKPLVSDPAYEPLLKILPVKPIVVVTNYVTPSMPNRPEFAGLTLSDIFYRRMLTLPLVSDGKTRTLGLLDVVPYRKGRIVFVQVTPDMFNDAWQRTKVQRLWNTLLNNLGAANRRAPDFKLIGGYGQWEEWMPGYASEVKDLDKRPMVKESPVYSNPALAFDPDQHHVW
jgi:hypothetical protein